MSHQEATEMLIGVLRERGWDVQESQDVVGRSFVVAAKDDCVLQMSLVETC